jgi:hypothetical protein
LVRVESIDVPFFEMLVLRMLRVGHGVPHTDLEKQTSDEAYFDGKELKKAA